MSSRRSCHGAALFFAWSLASCCGSFGVAATAHPDGPTVVDLVRRSKLIEPDELESALADCRQAQGGKVPAEGPAVLQYLQAAGLLTSWQCEQFAAGKAK